MNYLIHRWSREQEAHVKGGLLRARFLFVVLNHGGDWLTNAHHYQKAA
ncbi:MAG: hypothetical protein AABN34_13000 [Acidobacteriota bacterium]